MSDNLAIPGKAISEAQVLAALEAVPLLRVQRNALLKEHTRFGLGGPASIFAETAHLESLILARAVCVRSALPHCLIGDGSNLIASDAGYRGIVLRWSARTIIIDGVHIHADAGAALQALVDTAIQKGLQGLQTMAGIPGSVGAAIYGNAGAYGHSISERIVSVSFLDGEEWKQLGAAGCGFSYRESIFKQHKNWLILGAELRLEPGSQPDLRRAADEIISERNRKFPPEMKCAGSIFKNLLATQLPPDILAQVPARVIREGKIAAGWFLEQVGAKGMRRGDIHVAGHHANLLYNAGQGTSTDLRHLIEELKQRVRNRYGIELEEEVQYIGDF